MKTIALFNGRGDVDRSTLLFHLAHMFGRLDHNVVAMDLDAQANLTSMCLPEEQIGVLWREGGRSTVRSAMDPLLAGTGGVFTPDPQPLDENVALLPGDPALADIEDELAAEWAGCLAGQARAFEVTSAFARMLRAAGKARRAQFGLIDVGPNLGAISRCALLAADFVVVPIGADMSSLRSLQNIYPALRKWRRGWQQRVALAPAAPRLDLPAGSMQPIGYVVVRFTRFDNQSHYAVRAWRNRAPAAYAAEFSTGTDLGASPGSSDELGSLKDYHTSHRWRRTPASRSSI